MVSGVSQNTVTSFSALQSEKASQPIEVTLFGRVRLVNDTQPRKAHAPIFWRPSGRLTSVSSVKQLKAKSPTEVTPAPITTLGA